MSNNSYSSLNSFRVLPMNGSGSEDNATTPNDGLANHYLEFVKHLQTFNTVIVTTTFNIIYAFGILANILLLVYIIYYKRYKTPVFCAILSLGVADLCVCAAAFLWLSFVTPFLLGPFWLCNVVNGLLYLSVLSSNYHISAFAVLRFVQLAYPLASRAKVTTGLLSKVCLTIWLTFSIKGVALACCFEALKISFIESNDVHICILILSQRAQVIFSIWMLIVWIAVPFIATSGFHVAKQVTVMLSHTATVTSQQGQHVRRQTDSRALAVVVVIYIVTMAPTLGQEIHMLSGTVTRFDSFLSLIVSQISYSNSAINPFIYLFAAESVRSDIKKMITCKK